MANNIQILLSYYYKTVHMLRWKYLGLKYAGVQDKVLKCLRDQVCPHGNKQNRTDNIASASCVPQRHQKEGPAGSRLLGVCSSRLPRQNPRLHLEEEEK